MAETDPVRADATEIRDELPEDLDVSGYVGPYVFPDNDRRRIPAVLYLVIAGACLAVWLGTRGGDPVLVNDGILAAAIGLGLVGTYQYAAGFHLAVDERDALVAATRAVDFAVGHASAQLGWRGLRSRPTWRILVYSAEDPPAKRGLVLVDGVVGTVLEHFVEDNPEDWSDLVPAPEAGAGDRAGDRAGEPAGEHAGEPAGEHGAPAEVDDGLPTQEPGTAGPEGTGADGVGAPAGEGARNGT